MKEVSSKSQSLECATWMDINLPKMDLHDTQSVVLLPSSSTACECGRNSLQIFPSQNSPQGFRGFWVSTREVILQWFAAILKQIDWSRWKDKNNKYCTKVQNSTKDTLPGDVSQT